MSDKPDPIATHNETLGILTRAGALIRNTHVVYRSGKHGDVYVNKDAVYPNTTTMFRLGQILGEEFYDLPVEAVLSPAIGGVLLGHLVTRSVNRDYRVHKPGCDPISLFAEKMPRSDRYCLKRGYGPMIRGKRVLIIDDVLTTGGSIRALVQLAHDNGCIVVGIGAMCNRGGVTLASMGAALPQADGTVPRFRSLVEIPFEAWPERDCPLCKARVPINEEVGRGREYVARRSMTVTQRMAFAAIDRLQRFLPWRDAA